MKPRDDFASVAIALLLVGSNVGTYLVTSAFETRVHRPDGEQIAQLTAQLGELRRAFADTRKALKEKELVVAMIQEGAGDSIASALSGPPVPSIDAHVLSTRTDVSPALVLLDVGSDDKVEKGFHFSVYRGSEFVGKVQVEKALAHASGCRVLFTKDGDSIQAGDSAATRLQ